MAAPKWIQKAAIKVNATDNAAEKQRIMETRIQQRIGIPVSKGAMYALKADISSEAGAQKGLIAKLLGIK